MKHFKNIIFIWRIYIYNCVIRSVRDSHKAFRKDNGHCLTPEYQKPTIYRDDAAKGFHTWFPWCRTPAHAILWYAVSSTGMASPLVAKVTERPNHSPTYNHPVLLLLQALICFPRAAHPIHIRFYHPQLYTRRYTTFLSVLVHPCRQYIQQRKPSSSVQFTDIHTFTSPPIASQTTAMLNSISAFFAFH